MQKVKIPITIDPFKAAQKRSSYEGVILSKDLPRLREAAKEPYSDVAVQLHCGVDEQGLTVLKGSSATTVNLQCQRCNELMVMDLTVDFAYSPVASESKVEDVPERYEPIVVDEFSEVSLRQIVEDELILALPLVPMHEPSECRISENEMTFGVIAEEKAAEKPNPFEVLKQLKSTQD